MKRCLVFFVSALVISTAFGLDRQANADYHARREALSKKTDGGAVLLFAPDGGGGSERCLRLPPGRQFLLPLRMGRAGRGATDRRRRSKHPTRAPARPYTEILFLAANNTVEENGPGRS